MGLLPTCCRRVISTALISLILGEGSKSNGHNGEAHHSKRTKALRSPLPIQNYSPQRVQFPLFYDNYPNCAPQDAVPYPLPWMVEDLVSSKPLRGWGGVEAMAWYLLLIEVYSPSVGQTEAMAYTQFPVQTSSLACCCCLPPLASAPHSALSETMRCPGITWTLVQVMCGTR